MSFTPNLPKRYLVYSLDQTGLAVPDVFVGLAFFLELKATRPARPGNVLTLHAPPYACCGRFWYCGEPIVCFK